MKKNSKKRSAFLQPRILLGFALCSLGAAVAIVALSVFPSSAVQAQNQKPGNNHKVSVTDRQLVANLTTQGGRVVADYGSFVLMNVSDSAAASLAGNHNAQVVDSYNQVLLNSGTIDTSTVASQAARAISNAGSGKQMRLVQFAGPIRAEWYAKLQGTGAHIVTYIPNNAYLVYGNAQQLQAVRQLATDQSMVQWDGDYNAASRLDPAVVAESKGGEQLNLSGQGHEQFVIQMVEDSAENAATLGLINQLKTEAILSQESNLGYVNVKVALPKQAVIDQLAKRGDVVSIQQWITPTPMDERQDIILTGNVTGNPAVPVPMDYLAYLTGKGYALGTVSNFAVNLSDTGLDNATQTPGHFGLYRLGDPTNPANSRVVYNRLVGTPNGGSTLLGCDGHGTENAHIIGGYVPTGGIFASFPHADSSGFRYGLGVAPFVKIGSTVIFDPNYTNPIFKNIESQAYRDSARISSNSWGEPGNNTYNVDSQSYDALVRDAQPDTGCTGICVSAPGNQEMTIVFAAGNSGPGTKTVSAPSTGKNLITVGAAENVQAFGGSDKCGITDTGADNANDIISFSGRGPTSDSRLKPDIMGPGTHVSGGVAQRSIVSPTGSGTGLAITCFNGADVCGGTGGSNFFPIGQQWYTASSGTSHSTPDTAGLAALVRQHFQNISMTPPSPAMVKGLLMNSARYMNGVGANDTLPSNNQGMGEGNMNSYFDIFASSHTLRDEVSADLFTATGQTRVFTGNVGSSSKAFRVTLGWTDTPGPTSGNAFVNNLDLSVTVGGNTYKGNVFSGAFSTTGGTADIRNNVESVFIPAGVSGPFTVTVTATNIAGDGVPGNSSPLDQDFALVVANGGSGSGGSVNLVSAASRLTHGSAGTFDVPMPLTGVSGVEDRISGTYNAVFTFDAAVTSGQVQVTGGTATVGAITFSGNSMSAKLTGVGDQQVVTLRVNNINSDGQAHGDVPFGFLAADVNGNRSVDKPDQAAIQSFRNQAITAANFRGDVNISGAIDQPDIQAVKTNKRHTLP